MSSYAKWKGLKPGEFEAVVNEETNKKLKITALNIYNQIVAISPVDLGRFKANNIPSINEPDYSVIDDPIFDGKDKEASRKFAEEMVGKLRLTIEGAPANTNRIYIQNNLPYAEALENGHSHQAASGVYKVSFDAVVNE